MGRLAIGRKFKKRAEITASTARALLGSDDICGLLFYVKSLMQCPLETQNATTTAGVGEKKEEKKILQVDSYSHISHIWRHSTIV